MSFTLLLCADENNAVDITQLVSAVTWGGRKGSAARSLTAKICDDDGKRHARVKIGITDGYRVIFSEGGRELFRGLIMKVTQDNSKTLTFTAYDMGIYLANNQDTFCYTGKTADEIFTDVCKRFGIPMGTVAKCSYKIPELTKSSTTAYDVLCDALSLEFNSTGIRHYISASEGKLSLLTRRDNILQWVIEAGQNLKSYTYSQSIESIKTRVNLLSDEQTVAASAADSALEAKIGQFQQVDKADETYNAAQLKLLVDSMLEEASAPARMLSLEAVGISEIISGMAVTVIIKHLDISRTFYVDDDQHIFDGGDKHRMSLKLNYARDIQKPIIVAAASGSKEGGNVYFHGGDYYVSANSTTPITRANAGPAKIIKISKGALHPYYLQHTDQTSVVYGWVDEGTFSAASAAKSTGSNTDKTVKFYGGNYYVSANSTVPIKKASAGPAKIIQVSTGSLHPYYLQHTDGSSDVYGWVDAGTFG